MNPSRTARLGATLMVVTVAVAAAVMPAAAQSYDAAPPAVYFGTDPLVRSPRLLGMGRLILADDLHNKINLWDFAGNPTGVASAESVSVVEYRPGTQNSSAIRHLWPEPTERQILDFREVRNSLETWKRSPSGTAYGLVGDITSVQQGEPFDDQIEARNTFVVPAITGVVNGRMPWVKSTKFDYSLRLNYGHEGRDQLYYEMYNVPQGQYLGFPTASANAPDLFAPDRVDVSALGLGGAVAMRVTPDIKVALGFDHGRSKIASKHEGIRSSSTMDERRPFNLVQGSVIAKVGKDLELGLDARGWSSKSEEFFNWTLSAGQGQTPLSSDGKRLDRDEQGSLLRTRARYLLGSFEIGASLNMSDRELEVTPWYPHAPDDPRGFNDFLNEVAFRQGADTLLLPKRVSFSHTSEDRREMVGGLTWHPPGGRGSLGGEYHYWRGTFEDRAVGKGPEPSGWEVRTGGEYRLTPAFQARGGFGYGLTDQDDLVEYNTFRHTTATVGFGCQPGGARWSLDLGYAMEWLYPDFVSPTRPSETRQQLAIQARWPF